MKATIFHFNLTNPPVKPTDYGVEGYIAFDNEYLYIFSNKQWRRTALSRIPLDKLSRKIAPTSNERHVTHDASYFYLYLNNEWKSVAIGINNPLRKLTQPHGGYDFMTNFRVVPPPKDQRSFGQDGYLSYDNEYFYVYIQKRWHKTAISTF